ncbi:asparagine synthase (glutamine-hydrolyzing) [bacterium]|mgnify:CR=1 FL=1|nr:asparagine synthase (glutamine-hydrolyzing) [bacterium]|tara:strand:- start:28938 stop:30740 length:1803 start_codon:yes stop_codon:yes gene_type:complete
MCAIIGLLGAIPEKTSIIKARDTMEHRGPDDAGLYYEPENNIALGHRRLSIIDLSKKSAQPFVSADGRFVITYNGELYNYKEIKKELSKDFSFTTESDTEVLLNAYIKWGAKCLDKFNGMFAFAIWDKETEELFLVRDRFGIKPLFYFQNTDTFYFASEVKGILSFGIPKKLNKRALIDYLSYRYPLGGETFFEGIYALLPGHSMVLKKGQKPVVAPYWKLSTERKIDPGKKEALAVAKKLLETAVRYRMISDVSVGAYLSGGLDSSVIVGLMSKFSDKQIKTFSAGFREDEFNELPYAREVSKIFNTDHHEIVFEREGYFDALRDVVAQKDAPLLSPNEVPWSLLSKKLKEDITVVLSGGGADELFAGYGRIFRDAENYQKSHKTLKEHFFANYPYIPNELTKRLVKKEFYSDEVSNKYFDIFNELKHLEPSDQYLYIFQNMHLLGTLSHLDNVTMSYSVEGRVPFVDHRLVEYVSSLPLDYKMRWKSDDAKEKAKNLPVNEVSGILDTPKYLLKEIAKEMLPPELIERKKMGFPVPLDRWLRGESKTLAEKLLLAEDSRTKEIFNEEEVRGVCDGDSGLHIWMLINIEIFMRQHDMTV